MKTNCPEVEIKNITEDVTFDLGLMDEHELLIQVERRVRISDYAFNMYVLYHNLNV